MKSKITKFPGKLYDLRNVTNESADVFLYDEIGYFGVSANDALAMLRELKVATINVHINSPGGSVFDGFAIYNALQSSPARIIVHVDGIAASIASVIAMAGDEIRMASNAMIMIHRATAYVSGDAEYLRKQADVLEKLESSIIEIYAKQTAGKSEDISAAMKEETWMTAAECLERGFCTSVVGEMKIAACFDFSAFKNAPTTLAAPAADKTPPISLLLLKQSLLEKQ